MFNAATFFFLSWRYFILTMADMTEADLVTWTRRL